MDVLVKADRAAREFSVSRSTYTSVGKDYEAIRMGAAVGLAERCVRFDLEKLRDWHEQRSLRLRRLIRRPGRPRKGAIQ